MAKPLHIYASAFDETAMRQVQIASSVAGVGEVFLYRSTRELQAGLMEPALDTKVVLLLADSREGLERLNRLADLLKKSKIILILSREAEKETNLAHRLHPRFLSFGEQAEHELGQVLERMMADDRESNGSRFASGAK